MDFYLMVYETDDYDKLLSPIQQFFQSF